MPWKWYEILLAHVWKKLDRGFPKFDRNPENEYDITNNELWTWNKLFWTISNVKTKVIRTY
jgi:hypothetical protein